MEKKMNTFNRSLHSLPAVSGTDATQPEQALHAGLQEVPAWPGLSGKMVETLLQRADSRPEAGR